MQVVQHPDLVTEPRGALSIDQPMRRENQPFNLPGYLVISALVAHFHREVLFGMRRVAVADF